MLLTQDGNQITERVSSIQVLFGVDKLSFQMSAFSILEDSSVML